MSSRNNGAATSARRVRRIVLWASIGAAASLFIVGSIYSGMLFLSNTDAVSQVMKNTPETSGQKPAGSNTSAVGDAGMEVGTALPAKEASDPRFAFLLMGYGGGGHDGALLTDSMMVVIVDPSQKTLTLLSLPRDAWVPILFDGQKPVYSKLNTAYAYARDSSLYPNRLPRYKGSQGAGILTADTVSHLLGIPITYYLALDFAGFRQAIDAVGGIDVDIPDSFSAEYPANDDPSIDDSWIVVSFRKGVEHMNGERAIRYARARETIDNISEGGDFARSRRQRLIMEAFKTPLFQPDGLVRLPQLLAVAAGHVDTNYNLPSVAQLTQLAMDWKSVKFYQAALTNANYLAEATGPEGAYILVPNSPQQSWAPIRAMARRLWKTPELGVAMINTEVVVENATGVAGVAGRLSEALARLGYRVGAPTTGPARTSSQVVDCTGGEGDALISQLETDLGVHWSKVAPEKGQGGIVLQIGSGDAGLANLAAPADGSAPSSAAGVTRAGSWAPQVEAPLPAATTRAPTPLPSPRRTPVPATAVPSMGNHPGSGTPHSTTPAPTPGRTPRATAQAPVPAPSRAPLRATARGDSTVLVTPATSPTLGRAPAASPTPAPPNVVSPTPAS